ncbi:hypothetical protein Smed_1308 [Sinorhizobium medicae WSM419]|uniref:Uncharacterized protein n=1 Tax=Sinorhizobium medicae (strain WSM419) TaxID=366394 RepID=A6U928_SINMW|nr:hypothetical protein Smed_1308 [Sinorhizobium medicae WSM419]
MVLEVLQGWLTAIATGAGVYVAIGGLNSWRRETTGKRDIELCQAVIERFYEAEHRMDVLRSPYSFASEAASRQKGEHESEDESYRLDLLFVPLARLEAQSAFWSELFSYKFRMRALFGEEAATTFKHIDDAYRSFRAAAVTRYQALHRNPDGLSPETQTKLEERIWAELAEPDEIAVKMREAINAMERVCIPIVRSTRPAKRLTALLKRS